eukprot:TRINITY_DN4016_c0_g2_i6.p3 TRINITY_DN4016_c0_g2~~TRINITY_DN4016_c0_g2_i6.p3  ORF type:complete len:216 (+),score=-14.04 TRINITY_DN4016_c0_g2_i6:814-1461(+)
MPLQITFQQLKFFIKNKVITFQSSIFLLLLYITRTIINNFVKFSVRYISFYFISSLILTGFAATELPNLASVVANWLQTQMKNFCLQRTLEKIIQQKIATTEYRLVQSMDELAILCKWNEEFHNDKVGIIQICIDLVYKGNGLWFIYDDFWDRPHIPHQHVWTNQLRRFILLGIFLCKKTYRKSVQQCRRMLQCSCVTVIVPIRMISLALTKQVY